MNFSKRFLLLADIFSQKCGSCNRSKMFADVLGGSQGVTNECLCLVNVCNRSPHFYYDCRTSVSARRTSATVGDRLQTSVKIDERSPEVKLLMYEAVWKRSWVDRRSCTFSNVYNLEHENFRVNLKLYLYILLTKLKFKPK